MNLNRPEPAQGLPYGRAVHTDIQHSHRRGAIGCTAPVLTHPRTGRWAFLIRADLPDDAALFAEMFRHDICPTRPCATIVVLPSPPISTNTSAAGYTCPATRSAPPATPSAPAPPGCPPTPPTHGPRP